MRPIPGWPGYHVDEEGRVYTTRRRVHIGGLTWAPTTGHPPVEIRPFDRKSVKSKPTPYLSVALSRDGRRVNKYVHELVALVFLGPRPEGFEILHGKEGSSVNRVSNLRYGTPEENSKERVLPRGDAWYRARGMRPPSLDAPTTTPTEPVDGAHAFADFAKETAA